MEDPVFYFDYFDGKLDDAMEAYGVGSLPIYVLIKYCKKILKMKEHRYILSRLL